MLAGIIASPSMYDPVENPRRAKQRRNLVLDRMLEQGLISEGEYAEALDEALPTESEIDPPQPDSDQPYFTSWLTQQLVDRYKAPAVFSGGLKVKTTLDPELQTAAEQAINGRLGGIGPSASLVAIENKTGEVKAMVGGTDFEQKPFNLATNGHRQPGSAFKPFILVRALQDGVSPEATFASQKKEFPVPNAKGEKFVVNNYEDSYSGIASLRSATARSDNSVYAELGLKVGTKRVAELAQRMGMRTKVSTNPAMTLGGLKEGVTPLEMAFAYSTIANKGVRVSGCLASYQGGPVAIQKVDGGGRDDENEKRSERVFPASGRRDGAAAAGGRGAGRHRQRRADRRVRRRQDRHHRELRRRLVRGLQQGADRGRLGGLPGPAALHEDRVPRRARWPAARSPPRSGTTSCAPGSASASGATRRAARTTTRSRRPPRFPAG